MKTKLLFTLPVIALSSVFTACEKENSSRKQAHRSQYVCRPVGWHCGHSLVPRNGIRPAPLGEVVEQNTIAFFAVAGDPIHDEGVQSVDDNESSSDIIPFMPTRKKRNRNAPIFKSA